MRVVLDLQGAQTRSRYRGIGRYSLELAKAMTAQADGDEVWICLSALMAESVPAIRNAFDGLLPDDHIVVFDAAGPVQAVQRANEWRIRAGALIRESFLNSLQPDMVYILSMFEGAGDDALTSIGTLPHKPATAVTIYDFIPLLNPAGPFGGEDFRRWYGEKVGYTKRADLLLAISESARQEAIKALECPADRVVNISIGVDPRFFPVCLSPSQKDELLKHFGVSRPFVMYSGALEERKNVGGLLEGFAALASTVRRDHQIVIAGDHHREAQQQLREKARKLGLHRDTLVFAGYVTDEDLVALYSTCAAFVLPSLHEGFGLPALEAMACGAPTIGSDRTSIPEAIGLADALFDPMDSQSIAEKLALVLADQGFRSRLREHGLKHARNFTWPNTANKAWGAMRELRDKPQLRRPTASTQDRPRLALITPVMRTVCRAHHVQMLASLSKTYAVEVVVHPMQIHPSWQAENVVVHDRRFFEAHADQYDRLLYVLCDSPLYLYVLELLEQYPGTLLLGAFSIARTLSAPEYECADNELHLRELYRSHGYRSVALQLGSQYGDIAEPFPCNRTALQSAAGVIASRPEYLQMADDFYGKGTSTGWACVPLRVADDCPDDKTDEIAPATTKCSAQECDSLAELLSGAIEHFAQTHPLYAERRLLSAIAGVRSSVAASEADLLATAAAIVRQRPRVGPHQLLLDVSGTARFDPKTGIQRVTRHLTMELIERPPAAFTTEPVAGWQGAYTYARQFTLSMLDLPIFLADTPVSIRHGDIFLGVDLCPEAVAQRSFFEKLSAEGIRIYFVVHDLLAIRRPELFPAVMPGVVTQWLSDLSRIADGLVCVSRSTADDLLEWLDGERPSRSRPLEVGYFHHGANINPQVASRGLPLDAVKILSIMGERPTILMVGTIEPRKGHQLALSAFERLWKAGRQVNLVIVGAQGWKVESLTERIRSHPETGNRLFWLEGISDEMLFKVYDTASALLAASEAEGFGLPLIEAASHGRPIIARDIPVFREVGGDHAFYFQGNTAAQLADDIERWLNLFQERQVPSSTGLKWLSWRQSAAQLMDVVLGRKTYKIWYPPASRNPARR
jgi:glycosyltransferase involved in cell wall biosynthesis